MLLNNCKQVVRLVSLLQFPLKTRPPVGPRQIHVSRKTCSEEKQEKQIVVHRTFENCKNKNKDTYLDMIYIFVNREHVYRRGHVEFIYAALKNMQDFGVHKDLEVYKGLIDVMPKGKFVARNILQAEFMHYPKQQQCIIDLLEQMEDNGVMPDYEMEEMLANVFGRSSYPIRKYWRMMYWMPKFKNLSPWPLPENIPRDTFELAKLAIERITSVDVTTTITVFHSKDIEDALEDTWIVSAQSPSQQRLVERHPKTQPVYVDGPFRVWLKDNPVNYFLLRTKPKPAPETETDTDSVGGIRIPLFNLKPPIHRKLSLKPSVHEQEDQTIFSVCATGTSSKDSLLSWIRHLEKSGNPALAEVPVVFTLRSGSREVAVVGEDSEKPQIEDKL